jgi:alpha-galactosidase
MDDGWFGRRDDDTTSLGDWWVHREKFPRGLEPLARQINELGMKFGLWFEPEMISPDSDLYREHPDWCLHVPDRSRTEARNQLILDLSRADVQDAIIRMVGEVLATVPIGYVKWDMNRNMTEVGSALLGVSQQRETAHRYMLGLYRVLEELTTRFPEVLFESCSGGGGRFDPGILHYMPQTWTSDNTDAISRLGIQHGTSLVYPAISMGAHVSASPNHQVGRDTSLATRGIVAMAGTFGYEMDLNDLSDEELELVSDQVSLYKEIRSLVQFGEFYRLKSPFESNETAWMFVNAEQTEAVVMHVKVLSRANAPLLTLKLKGLNPNKDYLVGEVSAKQPKEWTLGGDVLMQAGLRPHHAGHDFNATMWRLTAK